MKAFFPMPARERIALFALIAFSTIAFLPVFGETSVLGVAVFGWLMAVLLLGSPAMLLLLLLAEPDRGSGQENHESAELGPDP